MKRIIILEGRSIDYELVRKNVKNINIRIKPDGVHVSAPGKAAVKSIEDFMRSKSVQIISALDKFAARADKKEERPSHTYENGDRFTIFGQERILCVSENSKPSAGLVEKYIFIAVKDTKAVEQKRRALEKLMLEEVKAAVLSICDEVYPYFEKRGIARPEIRFRRMTSCWGVCHYRQGYITFNTALIGAPKECIRYVVFHEFVHFLHPDHSPNFYKELSFHVPAHRELKEMLKNVSVLEHCL